MGLVAEGDDKEVIHVRFSLSDCDSPLISSGLARVAHTMEDNITTPGKNQTRSDFIVSGYDRSLGCLD